MNFEALIRILHFYEDQLPIVATNLENGNDFKKNNIEKNNIERTILHYLQHNALESVYFTAPYISEYFVKILEQTTIKSLFGIIDKDPPPYTKTAIDRFFTIAQTKNIDINIVKRPPDAKFIHMKVLIPIYYYSQIGLIVPCAIVGSANLTMNGFKRNDEMIVVLRNREGILVALKTLYDRGIASKNIVPKKA